MITVSLKLDPSLRMRLKIGNQILKIKVEEGITIKQLFDQIGIIPGEVGIIRLDKKVVNGDEPLLHDCLVEAFPIFGGG